MTDRQGWHPHCVCGHRFSMHRWLSGWPSAGHCTVRGCACDIYRVVGDADRSSPDGDQPGSPDGTMEDALRRCSDLVSALVRERQAMLASIEAAVVLARNTCPVEDGTPDPVMMWEPHWVYHCDGCGHDRRWLG